MQKWEYLYVKFMPENMPKPGEVYPVGYIDGVPRLYEINGQHPLDWRKGPSLHDYCNQLGEEGWELVVVDSRGFLWFKRPRS